MGECSKKGLGGKVLCRGTIPDKVSQLENDSGYLNVEAMAEILLSGLDDRRKGSLLVTLSENLTSEQKKQIRHNLGIVEGSGGVIEPDPTPVEPDPTPDNPDNPDNQDENKYEEVDSSEIDW